MTKRGILVLVLWSGTLFATACEEELEDQLDDDWHFDDIVGGEVVTPGERPWQARLSINGRFSCGGSLIAARYVLTAGHCVEDDGETVPSSALKVTLGDQKVSVVEGREQVFSVHAINLHPGYVSANPPVNDIAVLTLDRMPVFNQWVQAIWPAEGTDGPGLNAVVSGWGRTQYDEPLSDDLLQAVLPIRSNNDCNGRLESRDLWGNEICAGYYYGEKGGCFGDSGGPLAVQRVDGMWELVGVVSWGSPTCDRYGAFARVSSHSDWIYDMQRIVFGSTSRWVDNYGYSAGGWRVGYHPRMMADVNGDEKADVVGFAGSGVYVSLSTGSGFTQPSLWTPNFGYSAGGWRVGYHPRMMADVNNDNMADVIGFGGDGIYVSLSTGNSFSPPTRWSVYFGYNHGWREENHPRMMADVNNDNMADVIGFGGDGVYVSRSTGSSFEHPTRWVANFGYSAGGWRVNAHPRMMADVNGDDKADVVGFGGSGVYVSLSTGSGFLSPSHWIADFGYNAGGWRVGYHPRMMADVNNDGRDDVVGFAGSGVFVALSSGNGFDSASRWIEDFGYSAGGWRVGYHPRMMVDVNHDGRTDVVGFGGDGVMVSLSSGHDFAPAVNVVSNFGYNAGGWREGYHPRMLADVDGDRLPDVVGFAGEGVIVSLAPPPR